MRTSRSNVASASDLSCAPRCDGAIPCAPCRRALAVFQIRERRRIRRDQSGARAGLDRHVAHGHALFHRQRLDRAAAVFEDVAGAAVHADRADDVQDQIFRRHAGLQFAVDGDRERFRFALQQALRRQHVADFGGADAERERAERAVRGGVAVAADDGHAGLRRAEFGADHVHDAAMRAVPALQFDAEFARVRFELRDLRCGFGR